MYSKIDEIILALDHDPKTDQMNLFEGIGGQVLFRYVHGLLKDTEHDYHTEELLNRLTQSTPDLSVNPYSLANGISGNCWLFQYLQNKQYADLDDDFFDEVDEMLAQEAYNNLMHRKYDFLHGAIGIMFNLLQRPEKNRKALELLTGILLNIRIDYEGNLVWQFDSRREFRDALTINLGLAHGLPSIMVMLSKLFKANILRDDCRLALSECYEFISKQKNPCITSEDYSHYPIFVTSGQPNKYNSRLAWCYGDLGIAIAYYTAGKNIQNNNLTQEGIDLFKYYSTYKNDPKLGVKDSSLCHGSAGVMHLFHRMYLNTGLNEFKIASEYWLTVLLKMGFHKDGIAGYKTLHNDWEISSSLLEGVSGVGLVLASYFLGHDPDWDECLLMS